MSRLTFWQLFRLVDDNTLEVLKKVKIGLVEFDPGSTITRGSIVAGVDFFRFIGTGADLEVEEADGKLVLKEIFVQQDEQ